MNELATSMKQLSLGVKSLTKESNNQLDVKTGDGQCCCLVGCLYGKYKRRVLHVFLQQISTSSLVDFLTHYPISNSKWNVHFVQFIRNFDVLAALWRYS